MYNYPHHKNIVHTHHQPVRHPQHNNPHQFQYYKNSPITNENYLTPPISTDRTYNNVLNINHKHLNQPKISHFKTNSDFTNNSKNSDKTRQEKECQIDKIALLTERIEGIERKLEVIDRLQRKVDKIEGMVEMGKIAEEKGLQEVRARVQQLQKELQWNVKANHGEEVKLLGMRIKNKVNSGQVKEKDDKQRMDRIVKHQMHKMNTHVQQLFQEYQKQVKNEIKTMKNETQFFKSNRKYSGNPITFTYEEYIKTEFQESQINQIIYYLDKQGYLLDSQYVYLLNGLGQPIQLSQKQLKMLRKIKILEQ